MNYPKRFHPHSRPDNDPDDNTYGVEDCATETWPGTRTVMGNEIDWGEPVGEEYW